MPAKRIGPRIRWSSRPSTAAVRRSGGGAQVCRPSGGGAAGLAHALGDDAFERDAQMRVMHERLRSHRVIAGVADAIAGAAQRLLSPGERPTDSVGGRRVAVEEQPLGVGGGDFLTRVGRSGRGDVGQGGGDVRGPGDALHRRTLGEDAGDRPTDIGDAFALPGGSEHDGNAAESARKQLSVDAQPLLLRDIGLIEHEDHGAAELGDLGGEEEIAEQVRRVGDEHHRIGAPVSRDVAGQGVDDDLFVRRGRRERVESGEVDELDLLSVAEVAGAGLAGDRDAGIIADALTQPGQRVEEGRLAGVGITDERDQEACIGCAHGWRGRWMGQSAETSTIRFSASARRRLTTCPPNSMASGSPNGALRMSLRTIPGNSPSAIRR